MQLFRKHLGARSSVALSSLLTLTALLVSVPGAVHAGSLAQPEARPNLLTNKSAPVSNKSAGVSKVPKIASAAITPLRPKKGSTLTCTPSGWSDPDGDKAGYRYVWLRGGKPIKKQTGSQLTSAYFSKGQRIQCRITPWDGKTTGKQVTSNTVSVLNSPAVLSSARLSATSPVEGQPLSVKLGSATDADGDKISFKYAWYVNGKKVSSATTLSSASWRKGDKVYVVVTPYDGYLVGPPVRTKTATATAAKSQRSR